MDKFEVFSGIVMATNLVLTLIAFYLSRQKVAAEKLDKLEEVLRDELQRHQIAIEEIRVAARGSLNTSHLSEVYKDLKHISEQVQHLSGQQEQMNELLRQLLAQQLRRSN